MIIQCLYGITRITARILAWISIVGMGTMVIVVLYWHLYPYKIIEVKQPSKVLNELRSEVNGVTYPAVKRGQILSYRMEYDKYMAITARVRRQLVNDRSICLMEGAGQAKMGQNATVIDVLIPPNIFPGLYRLQTFYEYEPNPIREIKYDYFTEWFEVLP